MVGINGFLHYKMCGLDYVYLANGYNIHKTAYGDAISIDDADNLHKVIGRYIVENIPNIRGQELRFFRSEFGFSQFQMQTLLGTTLRTYQKWEAEKNKPANPQVDRLIRTAYLDFLGESGSFTKIVQILSKLQEDHLNRLEFKETSEGWKIAA